MSSDEVTKRTAELGSAVGPLQTLAALARIEDVLAKIDEDLDETGDGGDNAEAGDPAVIDLRTTRAALDELTAVLAGSEPRIIDLAAALEGT